MKYRVTNTRPFPLTLFVPGTDGAQTVVLAKQGDTATVDLAQSHAEKIARRGAAKFDRLEDAPARRGQRPHRPEFEQPDAPSSIPSEV